MAEPSEHFSQPLNIESRLLVLCARRYVEKEAAEEIRRILQGGVDWECFLQLAFDHKIVPLINRNLESIASTGIPDLVRSELKRQIHIDIQRNLSLTRELLYILGLFEQLGIPAIPYKGPVLANSIYRDLSARSFGDIDILVRERDVLGAMKLLTSNGYEIIRPKNIAQADERLRSAWVRRLVEKSPWAYQVVFWNPERQGIVELHWRLAPKYVFPRAVSILWEDLQSVTLAVETFPTFSPENLMWLLCLHGTRHRWIELRWLCDINELIRQYPNLNWEDLDTRVEGLGVQRRLYLGLFLAHCIFDTPLPIAVAAQIDRIPSVKVLAREVIDGLFEKKEKSSLRVNFKRLVFQLISMDRLGDRWIYLVRFFKGIDKEITAERKLFKRFSLFSLSARLYENQE